MRYAPAASLYNPFQPGLAMHSSMKHLAVGILAWMGGLAAVAQSPGKFVPTGSMAKTRVASSATLLKNGRVLVAGGYYDNSIDLATAELYDPSTGAFTPTGNMTAARAWHSATLLLDGRVLIAGGMDSRGLRSAELYDPATGTFTGTADMNAEHSSANLLSDGRVLITGSGSAEIFDPLTGVFMAAGPLTNAGTSSGAILNSGLVLIPSYSDVSLYSVIGDSLNLVASLPGDHSEDQTVTLLSNGKVLISGGSTDFGFDGTTDGARLYDPRTGTIEGTGLMLGSRVYHTGTLLPGGRVLIVGGYNGPAYDTGIPVLTFGEQYDPSTGSFTSAGSLVSLREAHTATLLPDGTVLIAGGVRYANPPAELYFPPLRATSAASLTGPLAPESQASLFGSRLAGATESADVLSPPTSLGGISLRITDSSGTARMARLLDVSPSRIDFEVPAGTTSGKVTLEVVNSPSQISQAAAQIDNVAPALFAHEDNTAVAYTTHFERRRIPSDNPPVQLVLYATGIRNRSSLANVQCTIGGISVPVDYAGPNNNGVPGLDQVNLRLIPTLKSGFQDLVLTVDGIPSNTVSVNIVSPGRN